MNGRDKFAHMVGIFMTATLFFFLLGSVTSVHAQQQCYFKIPSNEDFGTSPLEGPYPSYAYCQYARNYAHNINRDDILTPCHCYGSAVPYNPLPALENTWNALNNQQANLDAQVGQLRQTNSALQNQSQSLENQVAALQARINDLTGSIGQRQREIFHRQKQYALSHLRGLGTAPSSAAGGPPTGVDAFGLKPLTGGTTRVNPVQTAWHQLNCSASISRRTVAAAEGGAPIETVRYLAAQAADALDGSPVQTPCNRGPNLHYYLTSAEVKLARARYRVYLPRIMARVIDDDAAVVQGRLRSMAAARKLRPAVAQVNQLKSKVEHLASAPPSRATDAQKKQADDALAVALNALEKSREAKQLVDDAGAKAQQDLHAVQNANDAAIKHPDQMDAIFSQLFQNHSTVPPPAH